MKNTGGQTFLSGWKRQARMPVLLVMMEMLCHFVKRSNELYVGEEIAQ